MIYRTCRFSLLYNVSCSAYSIINELSLLSHHEVSISWIWKGLLIAVHKDYFRVINHKELLFNDVGDRVAQLLHVELIPRFSQLRSNCIRQEIIIVNTHLLFPHDSSLCLERLRQVCWNSISWLNWNQFQPLALLNWFVPLFVRKIYKILQYVESYQKDKNLNPLPILLCGYVLLYV